LERKEIDEAKAALVEINDFILNLDPSIRSASFEILRAIYFAPSAEVLRSGGPVKHIDAGNRSAEAPADLAELIGKLESKKPSDNVMSLAAWLYSQHGVYAITAKQIKALGDASGLILPGRPDNTMRFAKHKGKSLFNQQGKGWQPTVSGELFFQEEYEVRKGNKPLPEEDD
jgi:hypothetical protein